jgi:hypothetical protein
MKKLRNVQFEVTVELLAKLKEVRKDNTAPTSNVELTFDELMMAEIAVEKYAQLILASAKPDRDFHMLLSKENEIGQACAEFFAANPKISHSVVPQ